MKTRALLAVVVTGALAQWTNIACGPPCIDDRCSLSATKPHTTRVDYTKPPPTTSNAPGANGSSTPPPVTGPGSAAPVGPGSAKPNAGSGSAGVGSGSAAPAPLAIGNALWELWDGDQFKMHVISKGTYPANTPVKFEIVKSPVKTPFVITLLVKAAGGTAVSEGIWNDCPEGKIKCDAGGTKTHAMKKPGQILMQGGINWAVTSVTDDKGTLVTWTNNLSREVLSVRLLR